MTATTCTRTSPESGMPCTLADTAAAHHKGHTGDHPNGEPGWTVSWGTRPEEHARWKEADQ